MLDLTVLDTIEISSHYEGAELMSRGRVAGGQRPTAPLSGAVTFAGYSRHFARDMRVKCMSKRANRIFAGYRI